MPTAQAEEKMVDIKIEQNLDYLARQSQRLNILANSGYKGSRRISKHAEVYVNLQSNATTGRARNPTTKHEDTLERYFRSLLNVQLTEPQEWRLA
jgi:hypothetical protein